MTNHAENLRRRMGIMLSAAAEIEHTTAKLLAQAQEFRRRADDLHNQIKTNGNPNQNAPPIVATAPHCYRQL